MTFKTWMKRVNKVFFSVGLSVEDIGDMDWWEMWNDETTPTEATIEALENEGYPMELLPPRMRSVWEKGEFLDV